jgi:NUMOD4 motif
LTGFADWLPVPGYEGAYMFSSTGDVYSLARRQRDGRLRGGQLLRQTRDRNGYWRVGLWDADGRHATVRVHDLVALFHGPKPPGMHVLHRGDDKDLNHRDRLRYGTPAQNEREKNRLRSRRLKQPKRKKTRVTDVTGETPTGRSRLVQALARAA